AHLQNINDLEEPLVEELGEKEVDFDDIPEDAKFIGDEDENLDENLDDEQPQVEELLESQDENIQEDFVFDEEISTQDKIKEELAAIDELDEELEELDEKTMDEINNMDENMKNEQDDFASLSEEEIKMALGETTSNDANLQDDVKMDNDNISDLEDVKNNEEMVDELSKSIAQTITSSITDDTLKAALKGMKMNININISFDESNKN
ncbi:hypothetical protein IY971_07390, partial [Campylobacter volucris]|nr:hypothetical protein [Campylobacter volucris]